MRKKRARAYSCNKAVERESELSKEELIKFGTVHALFSEKNIS
jgi:hypothetical protein